MATQIKVILITIPSSSHIYPILPIVDNLIKNFQYKFIIYSTNAYKTQIEKTGSEFRKYQDQPPIEIHNTDAANEEKIKIEFITKPNQRISRLAIFIFNLIDIAENNILYLAREIFNEKPDLILFENTALHAKLAIRLLQENFKLISSKIDDPFFNRNFKIMYYSTAFLEKKTIFPNDDELTMSNSYNINELVKIAIDREIVVSQAHVISNNYKINYIDPFHETFNTDLRVINLVLILPELHPRVNLYHENNKFVGGLVSKTSETTNNTGTNWNYTTWIMNSILHEFEPFDDKISGEIVEKKILIFIFLNCKLDENLEIYVLLLDAFNSMSTSKFTILISFNSQGSDAFEKLLKEKNLKLNINIIRLTNVERLEILKRSSLFITNGDIPSINESLYCGVPLLCLPVTSNQILYSNHISNELKLGVMIDFTNFNKQNFIESINNLIYNSIYRIECLKFSKLMKESQTIDNATKIIHNFIL
jgi:hypothetical protein